MSVPKSDRMGAAPLKSLNAFNLPKLKKFPSRPEPKGSSTQPTEEAENVDTSHRPTSPADLASPVVERKSSQAPVSKPTTTRKSRRQAKSRPSEVTVYYDAVQSPDEASTVTKQKPRQPRATKPPAKYAIAAAQPAVTAEPAQPVPDTYISDTQPEPLEADNEPLLIKPSADPANLSRKHKQQASSGSADDLASAAAPVVFSSTSTRRRSRTDDIKPPADRPAVAAPSQVETEPQLGQQQPHAGKAAEGFSDGQEIFKYMQQLAENAAELLPQDDGQEQKKRGRGRAKKDLRLVDALHQSWKGKSYYERLQELTRQEIEEQEQAAIVAGPEYKPMPLSQPPAAAADTSGPDSTSQQEPYSNSQQDPCPDAAANGRKRRTTHPRAETADSDTDTDDAGADAAAATTAQAKCLADVAGGPSKRRATAGGAAAAGRAAPAVVTKAGKAAAATGGAAAAAVANKARRTNAVAGAAADNKSPFVSSTAAGARPLSSRPNGNLAWESTPAAAPAGTLPERPPWSVGGSAAAAAGAAIGTAGPAAGTAKADRGAVQRLQTALEAKSDELTALKEQLKESQEAIGKLRADQKSHPKALAQLEKQKQALENKMEAVERKQTALERDNKGLQEKLAKQEAEKAALQEQLSKSDKEVKALRVKLKQSTAKLEKCQTTALKLQEMCAALAAEAQPVWIE